MPFAPEVTDAQAKLLRLARDGGVVTPTDSNHRTFASCCGKRWLATRSAGYVLTEGGRTALQYFDATVMMAKLWARSGGG